MTMKCSNRKLSNVKLTKEFHFRYLGLWVLISIGLVVVANLLLFLLAEQHWKDLYAQDTQFLAEYMMQRQMMAAALGVGALLFSAALVALAKTTAHRIAGPYVKLQRVFESVRDGNLDQELSFRKYDHLDELAAVFNEMMVEVRARARKEEEPL
jgi:nitrogen fixation/metabolism regulation signal transduction histidine kinase